MKFLGKIFSRLINLSIMELMIVVLIAGLTVGAVRFLFTNQANSWKYVLMQLTDDANNEIATSNVKWLGRQIKVGDAYFATNGKMYAQVIAVDNYDTSTTTATTFVTLKLRGIFQPKVKQFTFQNQLIAVGKKLSLTVGNNQLVGTIIQITDSEEEIIASSMTVPVSLRIKLIDSWLADAFVKQIPFTTNETNSNKPILEITSYRKEKSSYAAYSQYRQTDLRSTPIVAVDNMEDLVLEGKLSITKRLGNWYFAGNQPVKIGSVIQFTTPLFDTVYARIQEITLPENN